MSRAKIVIISVIMATASAAPTSPVREPRSLDPFWHLPCGEVIDTDITPSGNIVEELKSILLSIKLQHQLTLNDYLSRDYEFLYERVRIGVHEHQYIPNWVPGKRDVNIVRRLAGKEPQTIANHLPKLHLDLQKFAVAIEELIDDEPTEKIMEALRSTQSYLQMMLCEVESDIGYLPDVNLPERVPRSMMTAVEREPVDETRRLVRDWGVLLKYKDYLHAWRHVFDY
ncbi:uncharacterized protein LOC107048427 [Diachasma alloeum]|uniref:uncharacterized protein LOC107048427 n=1 Tax=Diachasma alloeum TaxID=454923 RepID=UPI00073842AC|nr:uncharacterized protein LOC107048427 [Diachasma alloeum]